ncbi:MAG: diguanylate cyclase [Ruminiclostridium sp.]|nr:diguanylate cyclase [Ruminiclostridium sp.]
MIKTIKNQLPTIVAILFTIIILAVTLLWFNGSIDGLIEDTTQAYLAENAKAVAAVFNTKLDDQLVMLESQVRYFSDIDLTDYNAMKSTIMSTKGIGAFKTIGVANSAGTTINYNGMSSGNILLEPYFKEAMTGVNAISDTTTVDEEGDEVLVLAVPIKKDGKVNGVVFGTFDKSILGTLVDTVSFAQSGTNILLTEDGTVLARSPSTYLVSADMTNLFDYIDSSQVSKDEETVLRYRSGKKDLIVVLTPVGLHDWLFATVLPQSVISQQTSMISSYVIIVILAVAFAFALLFISILYLLKNNETITKSNERFKLVTVEAQDIIFDYDFMKKMLTIDGNTDNILQTDKNSFTHEETLDLLKLIHSDDGGIREEFLNVQDNKDNTIRGEFRVKCVDGTYSWFKLKSTVIRSNDGKAVQIVGSLINVDEQMNKELRLIQKAETDPLTGIFNKGAFYEHVQAKLNEATENDLFAIYIIDLDNFKGVNDNLGHAMGDQVLSDVAKKLCIVFSDKDCVGRIGGDEFAAFLSLSNDGRKLGRSIIENKAKAICNQMQETYRARKKSVNVSSSVGVAIYPSAGRDYETLYKNADKALYKVKENGKNMYSIYSEEEYGNKD